MLIKLRNNPFVVLFTLTLFGIRFPGVCSVVLFGDYFTETIHTHVFICAGALHFMTIGNWSTRCKLKFKAIMSKTLISHNTYLSHTSVSEIGIQLEAQQESKTYHSTNIFPTKYLKDSILFWHTVVAIWRIARDTQRKLFWSLMWIHSGPIQSSKHEDTCISLLFFKRWF